MIKLWDDFAKWLEHTSKVLSKEAGDLTLKGKLKLEMFEQKRRLNEYFTELGKNFYEIFYLKKVTNLKDNKKIKPIISKIRSIQGNIKKKEAAYKKIGKES